MAESTRSMTPQGWALAILIVTLAVVLVVGFVRLVVGR